MSGSALRITRAWSEMADARRQCRSEDLGGIDGLTEAEIQVARALYAAELEARVDAATAVAAAKDQELSAVRVELALKLLGTIRGGEDLSEADMSDLRGLNRAELARAEELWAEGIELARSHNDMTAARMAYLLRNFPGMTVGEAEDAMTERQRSEYARLDGSDL